MRADAIKRHGPPKKGDRYYSSYEKGHCDRLIKHMGSGFSFESFGAEVAVSKDTLYEWVKKYREFAHAKEIGFNRWLQFVEAVLLSKTTGREMIKGVVPKNIDIAGAIFMLKTRGHSVYFEKKEVEIGADESITVIVK